MCQCNIDIVNYYKGLIKLRKKYEDLNDENEKAKVISQINENEIKIMEELRKHITSIVMGLF